MSKYLLIVGILAVAGACKDDAQPSDVGSDVGIDEGLSDLSPNADSDGSEDLADLGDGPLLGRRTLVPEQQGVSPDGASEIDVALTMEARAGRITTQDTGFHGLWSHCKQGDFKLYNDLIEVCISNEISARYETFAGGALLDARVVGETGPDVFDLYAGKIGYNVAHPETVKVVRDGSDGGPAVVRAVGTDMPAAYFVGVAGSSLFTPGGLAVSVEYRLAPGSSFVEILTYVENVNTGAAMAQKGDLIAWGDRATAFRQDAGFQSDTSSFSWMAAHAPGYAFAWVTPDDELTSLSASLGDPPWEITQAPAVVLQSGESLAHFGRMYVGASLDEVIAGARREIGEEVPEARRLHVSDATGADVPGRQVEVFDAENHAVTGGTTDATGSVWLSIPDGAQPVTVSGIAGGGGFADTIVVTGDTIEVEVPTVATVELNVTAGAEPSPAGVEVDGALGSYSGAVWGTRNRVQLMPGTWTFTLSRGPEYDQVVEVVTLAAGEVLPLNATLTRLMDTSNWIAGDFHQHMEPSSDSRVWVEDRVLDNAGQGVELVVPTDHDVVTDLVAVLASAGLDTIMSTFPGAELSPAIAHTNVYPLPYQKEKPGRGTIPLAVLEDGRPRRHTVPELIALARALPTDPVVHINHPRDSSGLFDLVEFDPEIGPSGVTHPWFTTDFDAMEVSNGDQCLQFKDWAGLWNAGVSPAPIGSSDAHGVWAEVGEHRTYLYAPGTAANAVTGELTRDIIKAGQVVLGTSVLLDFTDGTVPGTTVDGSSGSVDFEVRVQSANWVGVDEIRVIVNGVQTEVIPVTPVDATLDYAGTITVAVTEDAWVTFLASGAATGAYRPSSKRPYSFNNAVRVDFDGGGYAAPGVRPLGLDDIPLCN